MGRQESPLEWLAVERGKLFNEGQKLDVFRGSHTLVVPLDVQVERRSPRLSQRHHKDYAWSIPCQRSGHEA